MKASELVIKIIFRYEPRIQTDQLLVLAGATTTRITNTFYMIADLNNDTHFAALAACKRDGAVFELTTHTPLVSPVTDNPQEDAFYERAEASVATDQTRQMKTILALLLLTVSCFAQEPANEWLDIVNRMSIRRSLPPLPEEATRAVPTDLTVETPVVLAWDASTDFTVTGYRIYYRNEAGMTNRVDTGIVMTVALILEPASYKLWAVSYNAAGVESVPSNEVSYTVPVTVPPERTAVIVLWTGPNAQGPWPIALTTNWIAVTNIQAYFNHTITLE